MLVLAMQFSKSAAKAGPGKDRPLESATALPENGTENARLERCHLRRTSPTTEAVSERAE
jgi:hypothetical protein